MSRTRTKHACIFSMNRLLKGKQHAFLWTFTFPDTCSFEVGATRWSNLSKDLVRYFEFRGVRVFELHPGGHGLHIHVVTDRYYDVHKVLRLAKSHGLGRTNVKRLPANAVEYVAKYLSKQRRNPVLKGKRLWQCVGCKLCRVCDVVAITPMVYLVRLNKKLIQRSASIPYEVAELAKLAFHAARQDYQNLRNLKKYSLWSRLALT